ncbi:MAG: hypothetical protein SGJ20_05160, partial [Planctomycetota bacterium]|nr:hypothetical protein [Planctomycetota bacterium]
DQNRSALQRVPEHRQLASNGNTATGKPVPAPPAPMREVFEGNPTPANPQQADAGTTAAQPPAGTNAGGGPIMPVNAELNINELPADWPDPRGLIPLAPAVAPVVGEPTYEPVLRHTRTYSGNDVNFTTALESYVFFRDEARMGGWQSYLQRSDDFIRFCCHMSITEMLTARGGAGETRVVWKWANRR